MYIGTHSELLGVALHLNLPVAYLRATETSGLNDAFNRGSDLLDTLSKVRAGCCWGVNAHPLKWLMSMKKKCATPVLTRRRHSDLALFFSHRQSLRLGNRAMSGSCTPTREHFAHFYLLALETLCFNECGTENDQALYSSLWLNLSAPYNAQFIHLYH